MVWTDAAFVSMFPMLIPMPIDEGGKDGKEQEGSDDDESPVDGDFVKVGDDHLDTYVSGFESTAVGRASVKSREQERLAARLWASFEEAGHLEDGMYHPAEQIMEQALRSENGQQVLEWLRTLASDADQPGFSAEVLRCLGRQTLPGTASWRIGIVRDGLAMDDVEMRDAAVQAAEWWGGPDMQNVLKSHSESEPWLQDYIWNVIKDLGE